tara:strand:- start:197 stop:802 length:606 start_codon:yes stop_codon:yes gene_type:complete
MQSLYQFIIEPIGERYNNKIKLDKKELIINSSISDHKFVNTTARVISTPKAIKTSIKKGDKAIVHHNLFRRYYDLKGSSVNSSKFFKDNMYFADINQVYMYSNNNVWYTTNDYCFIKPILSNDASVTSKLKKNTGILKHGNSTLEALEILPEDLVGFKPNREFQFIIDNELLYCMESNDIVIKYEHKRNETEYNPSWAKSS